MILEEEIALSITQIPVNKHAHGVYERHSNVAAWIHDKALPKA